jgi:hypothetical protein
MLRPAAFENAILVPIGRIWKRFGIVDRDAMVHGKVRFGETRVTQDLVDPRVGIFWILHRIGQTNFFDDAGLAGIEMPAVIRGTADVDADEAGRVPTENLALLDKHGLGTLPGRGDGRARARQTPAGD